MGGTETLLVAENGKNDSDWFHKTGKSTTLHNARDASREMGVPSRGMEIYRQSR